MNNMDSRQGSADVLLPSAPPANVTKCPGAANLYPDIPNGLLVPRRKRPSGCSAVLVQPAPAVLLVLLFLMLAGAGWGVSWDLYARLHKLHADAEERISELTISINALDREVTGLRRELRGIKAADNLFEIVKAMRNFEKDEDADVIDDEEKDEDDDALSPAYPDAENYDPMVEERAGDPSEHRVPLLGAGGRGRRAIAITPRERPLHGAQLRLYETLSNDALATTRPAPVAASRRQPHQKAPLFAERPPLGFVTPPGDSQTTKEPESTTPMTSRRSHVKPIAQHRVHPKKSQQLLDHVEHSVQNSPDDFPEDFASREVRLARTPRSIDAGVEVEQTWRPISSVVEGPAIAAHFVGDSTRHRHTAHYDENGRLKHPNGHYADWQASPWVRDLGLDQHFSLGDGGDGVRVDTPGLYFVYAQVNYANEKDENGFWVYRNGQKELLCVTTGSASAGAGGGAGPRANTCFTAGVLQLAQGDRVALRDLAGDRYRVLDHPGRSFIGLVNLQTCRLKREQPSRVTL